MRRYGARVVQPRVALVVDGSGMAKLGSMADWSGLVSGPFTLSRLKRTKSWPWSEMRWSMRTENWLVSVATLAEVA